MSAAARKQKSRQKLKDDPVKWREHLQNEKERDKARRERKKAEINASSSKLKRKRYQDAARQRKCRERKKLIATDDDLNCSSSSSIGAFKNSQSFGKAVSRSRKALPRSPNKKAAVVKRLAIEVIPNIADSFAEKKTRQTKLSTTIKEKVIQFFSRDDISRQAPGKRDVKSVKDSSSGRRTLIPKRYMLMTIGEAFGEFKNENKDILIGKSKFFELRPEHVMLSSQMPHNVCVCKYHANFEFLIQSLSIIEEFPSTGRNLLSLLCCNVQSEKCMTGICTDCHKDANMLIEEEDMDKNLTYKQWNEVDGFLKVLEINASISDAVKELNNQLPYYKAHCFIKMIQSSYFEDSKNSVALNEAILQVDFAENYSAVPQDEIQSAHWSHQQITIFTSCVWLHGNIIRSFIVVSNELNHDKFAVWTFLKSILESLKVEFPALEKIKIFSDGSAAQFKNKFTLSNLCHFKNDFDVIGEWNFFATSHGKGAVDAIGGMVKSKVWTTVKTGKLTINSANDFFQYSKHISGIQSLYISSEDVKEYKSVLLSRWDKTLSIIGLQSKHHFQIFDSNHLLVGKTARSVLEKIKVIVIKDSEKIKDFKGNSQFSKQTLTDPQSEIKRKDFAIGDFVLISLAVASSSKKQSNSKLYYATVLAINNEKNKITLKYMHTNGTSWYWPEKEDISTENLSVVIKKIPPPSLLNNRGYYYKF